MTRELILISEIEAKDPIELFTEVGAEAIIAELNERLEGFEPDISTDNGKELIRSTAAYIGKIKSAVEKLRVKSVEDLKNRKKEIDTVAGKIWDEMQRIQDDVRKPLTDYETAQKKRIQDREDRITEIMALVQPGYNDTIETATRKLEKAKELKEFDWQEFTKRALEEADKAIIFFDNRIGAIVQYEAEQVELAALRKQKAEQEQKEREDKIAKDAAEAATKKAEDESKAEIERLKKQNEATEAKLKEVVKAAPPAPVSPPVSFKNSGTISKKTATDAKAKINNEALAAFVKEAGLSQAAAKSAVQAIAKNIIPHITIKYEA